MFMVILSLLLVYILDTLFKVNEKVMVYIIMLSMEQRILFFIQVTKKIGV